MQGHMCYTDKIANEILEKEIHENEWEKFIKEKYNKKGLTLIGVRREKRIIASRMADNAVNEFCNILTASFCFLSGIVSYLLCDKLLSHGTVLKLFLPLIIVFAMAAFFLSVLMNMKNKSIIYALCNKNLLSIEEKLQEEYTRVEIKKIIDEDYMPCDIIDSNIEEESSKDDAVEEVEIKAFDIDNKNKDVELSLG